MRVGPSPDPGPPLRDPTHTSGEDAGGGLVEVEGADAAHAVRDKRQHVAAGRDTLSWRGGPTPPAREDGAPWSGRLTSRRP